MDLVLKIMFIVAFWPVAVGMLLLLAWVGFAFITWLLGRD